MSLTHTLKRQILPPLMFGFFFIFLAIMGTYVYQRTRMVMEQRLKEQIQSIATIGATQIDANLVESIHGKEDMSTFAFTGLVQKLQIIRTASPDIRFVYIMRRTEDPNTLAFVADADALSAPEELDKNKNGTVDENEEASYPGDIYDISGIPAMKDTAFRMPATDAAITHDTWGDWMSGYAPIKDASGNTVAILGIDMESRIFSDLSSAIIPPMSLLIGFGLFFCMVSAFMVYTGKLAKELADDMTQQLRKERDRKTRQIAKLDAMLMEPKLDLVEMKKQVDVLSDDEAL